MSLETATYISDLDPDNPAANDSAYQGDDHLRLIKATLKATFPYVTSSVLVGQTELNYLTGLSSNLVGQLALKAPLSSPGFSGTPTAPTAEVSTNSAQIATCAYVQAQKISPIFTGTPSAPTPATTSNSTAIATTEYVQTAISRVNAGTNTSRAVMYFFGGF